MPVVQSYIPAEQRFVDIEVSEEAMSTKSINRYRQLYPHRVPTPVPSITPSCYPRGRNARTDPPPSIRTYSTGVREQAKKLRDAAVRILAQAAELEESADRLEGK